jgi:hypothetical protein
MREQHDQVHAVLLDRGGTLQHRAGIRPLLWIRDEHEVGLRRVLDLLSQ